MLENFEKECVILTRSPYGFVRNGKIYGEYSDRWDLYRLEDPKMFKEYKIGTCYDYVHYQYYLFKNFNLKLKDVKLYFIDYFYNEEYCTHTIFTYKNKDKIVYYECAWKDVNILGKHEFKKEEDMFRLIKAIANVVSLDVYEYKYSEEIIGKTIDDFIKFVKSRSKKKTYY